MALQKMPFRRASAVYNSRISLILYRHLEEVTSQLKDLRAAVRLDLPNEPARARAISSVYSAEPSRSPSRMPSYGASFPSGSDTLDTDEEVNMKWLQIDPTQEVLSRTLEDVNLTADAVVALLEHFEQHIFPHLPILEQIDSISAFYDRSPVLFWTVMLVSSQWHPTLGYVFQQLVGPHENLLSPVLQTTIKMIEPLQALLLLCYWPIPKRSQNDDPSGTFSSICINAAMQMNLHQPLSTYGSIRYEANVGTFHPKGVTKRVKALTWIACFNVNVQVCSFLGLVPQHSSATQLQRISNLLRDAADMIPISTIATTEIMQCICRYSVQLDGIVDEQIHSSLTQVFDADLDAIQARYQDSWTPQLDLNILAAKLYLYALSYIIPRDPERVRLEVRGTDTTIRKIHLLGLAAACRYIRTMSDLNSPGFQNSPYVSSTSGRLLHYSKPYLTSLYFSAVFLLKFLSVHAHANQFDRESAINHVSLAYKFFSSFPHCRDRKRGAILIEVLARMTRSTVRHEYLTVEVNDRLGASLIFDSAWRAALMRNRSPVDGSVAPASQWLPLHDTDVLPLAPFQQQAYNRASFTGANTDTNTPEFNTQQMDQGWAWGGWDDQIFDMLRSDQILDPTGNAMTDMAGMGWYAAQ